MGTCGDRQFTFEVRPSPDAPGCFRWLIRDRGKLYRGSYRPLPSADAARAAAQAEVDQLAGAERVRWPG